MKKKIFGFVAASLMLGFVACNNDDDTTATTTDSTNVTTTASDVGTYSAKADSIRINSEQGNYLNPRTGKAMKLKMDTQTGAVTDEETNEPVWRYVDRRNWWVYGGDNWDPIGEARMDNDKLLYKGDGDKWVDYDVKWKTDDERMGKEWKIKYGDTKIKKDEDGDIKIKDGDSKTKIDADGDVKTKTN